MIIDRAAIIIKAKKPAVYWINKVDPMEGKGKISLKDVNTDCQMYLVSDDIDSEEMAVAWAYKNAEVLLEDFMHGWYQDESLWPKSRDIDLFEKWLEIDYHSMIIDTVDALINKEEM